MPVSGSQSANDLVINPLLSVRPAFTFPAAEHGLLASIRLYFSVTELAHVYQRCTVNRSKHKVLVRRGPNTTASSDVDVIANIN